MYEADNSSTSAANTHSHHQSAHSNTGSPSSKPPLPGSPNMKRTKTFSNSTRGIPIRLPSSTSASTLTALEDGLWTLYCQCQDIPEIPPFITVVTEVTRDDDMKYSSYNLSKRDGVGDVADSMSALEV